MWISNGGFADVFIVFAKVDGEHFTAFIVDRKWPGVSSGKEEHKLGLHGSSTTPIILQEVKVPADAVLGEIGKGHKVAFNVLTLGLQAGRDGSGGVRSTLQNAQIAACARVQHPIGRLRNQAQARRDDCARYALESRMLSHRRTDREACRETDR